MVKIFQHFSSVTKHAFLFTTPKLRLKRPLTLGQSSLNTSVVFETLKICGIL